MLRLLKGLSLVVALISLSGCGRGLPVVVSGQSYPIADDMTVRLTATHPTVRLLSLIINITGVGTASPQTLVPNIAVTPQGGSETASDLTFSGPTATITMTLEDAQDVQYVEIRDSRSDSGARWDVKRATALLGCAVQDQCQLLGLPQSQWVRTLP